MASRLLASPCTSMNFQNQVIDTCNFEWFYLPTSTSWFYVFPCIYMYLLICNQCVFMISLCDTTWRKHLRCLVPALPPQYAAVLVSCEVHEWKLMPISLVPHREERIVEACLEYQIHDRFTGCWSQHKKIWQGCLPVSGFIDSSSEIQSMCFSSPIFLLRWLLKMHISTDISTTLLKDGNSWGHHRLFP